MAAFVVVSSLLELVEQQLLQPKPCLVLHDTETIVSLRDKLHFLQAFLEESERKPEDPEAKEELESEIQDVATKAEGQIESKLRLLYLAANANGGDECLVEEACQQLYQTMQQVLKDIKAVEERILMLKPNLLSSSTNDFQEENIMVGVYSPSPSDLIPEDTPIVGFDNRARTLVNSLTNGLMQLGVFAICGMAGLGKTTLAKMAYENPKVRFHFHIRAWTVVSREHNVKEMLIHLLDCILPVTTEISNKGEAELAEQLRKSLVGKRYLIVLDDVWTTKACDVIQLCFPNNSNGSRILITTRLMEIFTYSSEETYFLKFIKGFRRTYDLEFLSDDECWEIINRKVFGNRSYADPSFKSLGKSICTECMGIPLAAVLIAGLLATVNKLEIWEHVRKTLCTARSRDDKLEVITSMCYNYLPNHLKACFLYFGVFSEDSSIPVTKLINLWIAERFLKPQKNKSLEEVAKSYLYDLINRNLVQIDKRSVDGKIKRCIIHDRVHEMCLREAKKKKIMSLLNENNVLEVCRWISCQSSYWPITRASFENHTFDGIRSILYFGKDFYLSRCRLVYPCLKLLRVLDLSLLKYSHGMPSGIADLIHLRYLALSTIGSIYKFRFSKLQNLQTLIVSSWMGGCYLQLSSNILDLLQLRHLHLEKRHSQCFPSLIQKNLQTLYWLKVASSDQNINFKMVPQLKELGIYIEGELVHGCLESLVHLHLLEKLKVEIGRVECFYLPTSFPQNLKQLTLRYTYLPWKEIHIVGKLPNLETLKLKDFAFCGSTWEQTEMGFKKLKVLLISRLDFTRWNASANHFPILEKLVLKYCWELKEVPIDFGNIKTLKSIVLEGCCSSLVHSANDIERWKWTNCYAYSAFLVKDLGTKVELLNNDCSEENSVEFPNNEGTDGGSVELPEKKVLKDLGTKVELLNDCSEENSVEFPNNEGTDGGSVELPEKKVLKSLSEEGKLISTKKWVKALKKKKTLTAKPRWIP